MVSRYHQRECASQLSQQPAVAWRSSVVTVANFGSHEGLFVALSAEAAEIQWEHECGRACSLLKHSWFVVVWPCVNDRVCVRTWTIPTWTEGLTFPDKQVMHATGAGAMTQELVTACFIQALHIAPKHRPSNIQFPEKRTCAWFGQAFLGVRDGKLVENLRKIGGKLVDKVLATKGAFSTC